MNQNEIQAAIQQATGVQPTIERSLQGTYYALLNVWELTGEELAAISQSVKIIAIRIDGDSLQMEVK